MVTVWFALVVVCWVLFFVLEGFDFGVGMLAPLLGRDEHERGAALGTIGPFWDGNEVWLVAAIGVTFAAFPGWYAALLSGLYLPMVLLLLLLAGRGVALEFRGKRAGDDAAARRWRRRCEAALAACSAGIVLVWGALLAVFTRGLAIGADGEVRGGVTRSLAPLATAHAVLGAAVALVGALLLGATFLALRTTGPVRVRARRLAVTLATAAAGIALAVGVAVLVGGAARSGTGGTGAGSGPAVESAAGSAAGWVWLAGAAVLAVVARAARAGREAAAFVVASAATAVTVVLVFTANGSVVLPSTLDAAWSLTADDTAATASTLRLLSVAAVLVLPGVLVYQAWSYRVFRRRVASERLAS